MSTDNGLFLAFGVAAGFAVAAGLSSRLNGSGNCAACGHDLHRGSLSRDVEDEDESGDDDGKRGSYLLKQRYDARAGFFVPLADVDVLDASYGSFRKVVEARAWEALRSGGLDGSAFVRLDDAQRHVLDSNGFGPRKGIAFASVVQPSRTIVAYARDKTEDPEKQLEYAVSLYVKRAWTLHVCEATGHLAASDRESVYGKVQHGAARPHTLFDGVSFQLVLQAASKLKAPKMTWDSRPILSSPSEKLKGMPYLRMTKGGVPVGFYFITDIGALLTRRSTRALPLLTTTSKMASPSFGLPAGSVLLGGTCPGADVDAQAQMVTLGREKICDVCYATSANYGYANNMTQQEARRRWVAQLLKESPEACGYNLACMIEAYARYTLDGEARRGQEIGVWSGTEIMVPMGHNKVASVFLTPLQISSLATDGVVKAVPKDTRIFFQKRRTKVGAVAGFFRIHDSGDFGVGSVRAYTDAWAVAAKLLPNVFFWAPSRIWPVQRPEGKITPEQRAWLEANRYEGTHAADGIVTYTKRDFVPVGSANGSPNFGDPPVSPVDEAPGEDMVRSFASDQSLHIVNVPGQSQVSNLKKLAELSNFTLRPSGLYIKRAETDPIAVPTIEGMVGSGVAAPLKSNKPGKHGYPAMADTRGVAAWQCPVYTIQADGKEAKSCRTANCRACWLAKDLPVFYGAH